MISGAHTIIYAEDAEAARAFLRDVLGFKNVDAGDGWLIFASPPGEFAVHPGPRQSSSNHELFFMCKDIKLTMDELEKKGVEFVAPVSRQRYGLMTRFEIPGAGDVGLYEPSHPSPLPEFAR